VLDERDWRYKELGEALFIGRVQYILEKVD
jgi:hypothetical protein